MNVVHNIELSGYCATPDHCGPLMLGTYGSREIEQLKITLGDGWEGMDVKVVFNPSGVGVMLPEDGLLTVPWEATSRALSCPDGAIVFQGFDGTGKLINTVDVTYKVLNHSSALGNEERPATPGIVEAVITEMKKDKEDILDAAARAKESETNAALSADSAYESKESARLYAEEANNSLGVIQNTELTSLANAERAERAASVAETSKEESATNARNAALSAESSSGSAENAASSATSALSYANAAANSANNAATSATQSANSATSSATSADKAKQSETNAQNSASSSANSATKASTSADNAKKSEDNAKAASSSALSYANVANSAATKASTSADNAKKSEDNAKAASSSALSYANVANSAATSASTSASQASNSAASAANSASQAATSSTEASESAENASNSASDAANSAVIANDVLEQIKAYGPEFTDSVFELILDGTNTTKTFRSWWPLSTVQGQTKYDRLCRFARMMANAWREKTYTLRSYNADVSGVTTMTPLDDLADKSPAQLCTETTEPVTDWADEDPMTWYIRANALSKADGTMDVTYIEGEDGFDIEGAHAPVYTFALALYIKEWTDGGYDYISFRTAPGDGFHPDVADIAPDGVMRPITWHSTFSGSLNGAGALTSGVGLKPYIFVSTNIGLNAARKMTPYEGLWNDCDTRWALRMWQLRHFDLENGNICNGCVSYNHQFQVAVAETDVRRVLLTAAQAGNLLEGSTVSIGDPAENTNHDRNLAYMRNIAEAVEIGSITDVTVDDVEYKAVNLVMDGTINVTATTWISTWPWISGNTEHLPGHKDGCTFSLTASKTPLRVAGVELLDGAYAIGLDPLYQITAGSDATHRMYRVYSCRDSEKLAGSITADYEDTGIVVEDIARGWFFVKRFIREVRGILFPDLFGGSSSTYFKSAFFGAYSASVCCPWRFSALDGDSAAGLACESGNSVIDHSSWHGRPRLSGAGKKRGK